MTTQEKAKELYNLIEGDLLRIDNGKEPFVVLVVEEFGEVVPMNFIEEWSLLDLQDSWEAFMHGQTFCEHGFYVRDVQRFLYAKSRGK